MTRKTFLIAAIIIILGITQTRTLMHREELKVSINSPEEAYEYTEKIMNADPSYRFKSSVYGMIEDNPIYDAVVAEGINVLPHFEAALMNATEFGYTEFMMAVIMEDIVQSSDENSTVNWSTPQQYKYIYKDLVNVVKDSYMEISSSKDNIELKLEKIYKLGMLAVPFICDDIDSGKTELSPALVKIISRSETWSSKYGDDYEKFMKKNKDEIEKIRTYVESH